MPSSALRFCFRASVACILANFAGEGMVESRVYRIKTRPTRLVHGPCTTEARQMHLPFLLVGIYFIFLRIVNAILCVLTLGPLAFLCGGVRFYKRFMNNSSYLTRDNVRRHDVAELVVLYDDLWVLFNQ
jgi:hypothetical protein